MQVMARIYVLRSYKSLRLTYIDTSLPRRFEKAPLAAVVADSEQKADESRSCFVQQRRSSASLLPIDIMISLPL